MSSNKQYGLQLSKKNSHGLVKKHAAFGGDSDSENSDKGGTDWTKRALKATDKAPVKKQTKIEMQRALDEDSSVYQYDEIYDQMQKSKQDKSHRDKDKKPKYIQKLMVAAEKRKIENERRIERQVQKEREAEGEEFKDKETFVTAAYKKKLEEFAKLDAEQKRMDMLEQIGDVTKQQDMGGFYRHLYQTTVNGPSESSQKSTKEENENLKRERRSSSHSKSVDNSSRSKSVESSSHSKMIESSSHSKNVDSTSHSKNVDSTSHSKNVDSTSHSKSAESSSHSKSVERRSHSKSVTRSLENSPVKAKKEETEVNSKKSEPKKESRHYRKRKESESSMDKTKDEDSDGGSSSSSSSSSGSESADEKSSHSETEDPKRIRAKEYSASEQQTALPPALCAIQETPSAPPAVPQKSIWEKRTVGPVFDAALKRYLERKNARLTKAS